jgi:AraC-like DNA-binding protein
MLAYSSQSHFIQHFRSQVGMTPKAYRDTNYMNNWNVNREPFPAAEQAAEQSPRRPGDLILPLVRHDPHLPFYM